MRGAAGVTTLVLAETVVGALAFLLLTPLWREVKRGFCTLVLLTSAVLALAALGSAGGGAGRGVAAGARGRPGVGARAPGTPRAA
ncbi:MAG: hypothetical protein ACKOKE_07185, partial [Actinomycetota bacterium]